MLGCRRPWVADGSAERAACHRHIIQSRQNLCLAVICRLPSGKRSHCFAFRGMAFARSPASWGEPLQQISRELRRNAATRSGGLDYRATTAQWHADRAARRPKPAKLAVNDALRHYVQDRLSGAVAAPDGVSGRWTKSDMEGETICTQAA